MTQLNATYLIVVGASCNAIFAK